MSQPDADEKLLRIKTLERYQGGPDTGIFTDGSSRPNPGPGGWGVVHVVKGKILSERCGSDPDTTNNRMELTALIEGVQLVTDSAPIEIYTDSELCVKTMTTWAHSWEKNGWKRKSGPIANLDLVQKLFALLKTRPHIQLKWIAGHAGWRWNEYADVLSTTWTRSSDYEAA